MSKPDPLDPREVKTTRFQISEDELQAREQRQEELNEPGRKAVMILEAALEKVMASLGVDIAKDIPPQQEALGITITDNTEETTPQLNGFFIFIERDGELIPHSWVGAVRIDSTGQCLCDIQWFMDERLDQVRGMRLTQ